MTLEQLHELGFDNSRETEPDMHMKRGVQVGCSQCEVMVINGTPCHETGCVNQTHNCIECDAPVKGRMKSLCDDCANGGEDFNDGNPADYGD